MDYQSNHELNCSSSRCMKHVALLETNCCACVEAVANLRVVCGDVDVRAHPYGVDNIQ